VLNKASFYAFATNVILVNCSAFLYVL